MLRTPLILKSIIALRLLYIFILYLNILGTVSLKFHYIISYFRNIFVIYFIISDSVDVYMHAYYTPHSLSKLNLETKTKMPRSRVCAVFTFPYSFSLSVGPSPLFFLTDI